MIDVDSDQIYVVSLVVHTIAALLPCHAHHRSRPAIRVAVSRPTWRPVAFATKSATRRQCAGDFPSDRRFDKARYFYLYGKSGDHLPAKAHSCFWGLLMAHYRIYIIDKSDPISRPPKEVECPNDAAAIDTAS